MINIILEFCDGGDLGKYLKLQMGKNLKEKNIWNFFIQACLGLQYLHTRKILHRDIKTINLFLMKDGTVKIGDLGVAKSLKGVNFAHTMVGTPYYLSPELVEEKAYDHKSDIWSLGCVLYELCTLKHPFTGTTQASLMMKIIKGKYDKIPAFYSKDLADLIDRCLKKDTRKRPSIHQILEEDTVKRKAKELLITIPTKEEVEREIQNQRSMVQAASRKKAPGTDKEQGLIKKKSSGSTPKEADKTPKLVNKSSSKPKSSASRNSKPAVVKDKKTEHQKKVEENEKKIKDRKERYLKKQSSESNSVIDNFPVSYLKDPKLVKKDKSQDDAKNQFKFGLLEERKKSSSNQRVIKHGVKHTDSHIVITKPPPKPALVPKHSKQSAKSEMPRKPPTGLSRVAKNAARKGSALLKRNYKPKKEDVNTSKDIEDVCNLPDFPNEGDSSSDDQRELKSAQQLMAEHKAKKGARKKSGISANSKSAAIDERGNLEDLHKKKMVIPKQDAKGVPLNTKANGSQQKIADADFDDILSGKASKSNKNDDQDLEAMLNGKPLKPADKDVGFSGYASLRKDQTPIYQVEAQWKIAEPDDEQETEKAEETKDEDDDIEHDDFSENEDDMQEAFNFTDTDFDVNNRVDFDIEVSTGFNRSLESIPEVEEESEKSIERRKLEIEIKSHESRIKEYETTQRQKWNHIVQYCNSDGKIAESCYEFASNKIDQLDDEQMEEVSSEIQNYVYAHGVDQHENMAFELF